MNGLGLLIGHLVGDYCFQNDWMATNKVNAHPGKEPYPQMSWISTIKPLREWPGLYSVDADPSNREEYAKALEERNKKIDEWDCDEKKRVAVELAKIESSTKIKEQGTWLDARRAWWKGHLACTVHCLCYTLAVALCSFWWMPWWGYLVTFGLHWPIDRFRLARRWMIHVSGQKSFATGPLAPFSVIIVDNTFHLATLMVIGCICGQR